MINRSPPRVTEFSMSSPKPPSGINYGKIPSFDAYASTSPISSKDIVSAKDRAKAGLKGRSFLPKKSETSGVPEPFKMLTGVGGVEDSFFRPFSIDGTKWNKLFPYRLIVIDANSKQVVSFGGGSSQSVIKISESRFNLSYENTGGRWEFRLPITPQQLSISTPFAIDTTSTLRGVLEEHNGVKFKIINFSGTMGQWPNRPSLNEVPESSSVLKTLFGGTIEAFGSLKNQIDRTVNALTQNHPANKPTVIKPEDHSIGGIFGTGYYHALLLDQFLEQYSEAKKDPTKSHWRLVLDIPKQGRSFIVTPVMFEWNQAEDKPNEIRYRLQLKAWKRIDLDEKISTSITPIAPLSLDVLQRIINTVQEARRTMASAKNLIAAVRSDFQTPFNILRELSLFTKDLAGITKSAIDLPRNIIQDSKSAIKDIIRNFSESLDVFGKGTSESYKSTIQTIKKAFGNQEGLSSAAIAAGAIGVSSAVALRTDPTNEFFSNPEENFELFNQVSVDEVNFSVSQQEAIETEIERIRLTSVDDLIQDRNDLSELASQISNLLGAGDDTYNAIYRKPDKIDRIQEMSIDEFEVLRKLYEVIQAIDQLTATDDLDQERTESAFDYVGSLAVESEMTFEDSPTKIRLPVPFGLTVEQIAARYLGDPDRWLELVTINALKSPYLDENGFILPLLSNADGRQFNISSNVDLFIGQKITLMGISQPSQIRRIINIEKISDTNYLITVDGVDNLDTFTLADQAKMKAYLPGTVNSQDHIWVPSGLAVTDTVLSRPIPATKGDPLVGMSRVDMLLDDNGDIATNSFGEIKIAAGITNIIQALKLKFTTQQGKLIKHPEYGSGLIPGSSVSDLNSEDIYETIKAAVESDPRFASIQKLEIDVFPPEIRISMAVNLANGQGVFPISFVLNS